MENVRTLCCRGMIIRNISGSTCRGQFLKSPVTHCYGAGFKTNNIGFLTAALLPELQCHHISIILTCAVTFFFIFSGVVLVSSCQSVKNILLFTKIIEAKKERKKGVFIDQTTVNCFASFGRTRYWNFRQLQWLVRKTQIKSISKSFRAFMVAFSNFTWKTSC